MAMLAATSSLMACPVGGTFVVNDVVGSDDENRHYVDLVGGTPSTVDLVGFCFKIGLANVDLFVYDDQQNLVGKSTGISCSERVTFIPEWTGTYKLVVSTKNHQFPVQYHLVVG